MGYGNNEWSEDLIINYKIMATSNIQHTGLEESIHFIEDEENVEYIQECVDFDKYIEEVKVYDNNSKEWEELDLEIKMKGCYYEWANLIIESSEDIEEMDLSLTSERKITRAIKRLEKVMSTYSIKIKCVGSFSNWETIFERC